LAKLTQKNLAMLVKFTLKNKCIPQIFPISLSKNDEISPEKKTLSQSEPALPEHHSLDACSDSVVDEP
jgi:hypothetical protein